jgi:hypothetical protein
MRQAYRDGQITDEESAILETLRQSLNISSAEHEQIETEVKQEVSNGGPILNDVPPPEIPSTPPTEEVDQNVIRPGANPSEPPMNFETEHESPPMDTMPPEPSPEMPPPPVPEPEEPQSLEDLLKAGKDAYHKNDFQMAIINFDKALILDGENSEALFFRKRSQSKLNETGGGGAEASTGMGPALGTAPSGNAMMTAGGVAPEVASGEIKGDPNCTSCNGAGTCRWCKSTGGCYWCKGNGQCDKCKGTGISKGQQCPSCAGSGKCHSCKGTGKCYWCQGSGKCSKCSQ